MLYSETGSLTTKLDKTQLRYLLFEALNKLGPRKRVLVIPPDFTRFHSQAGLLTQFVWEYYGEALKAVLPALGTHSPMTEKQIHEMFGEMPLSLFKDLFRSMTGEMMSSPSGPYPLRLFASSPKASSILTGPCKSTAC